MGAENKLLEEKVKPADPLQVYKSLAKFDQATGNIAVTLSFDDRSSIAGFNIGSIGRSD